MGKKILEISHLHKAFGNKVIVKDFSYVFKRQEKIGIVGKNGVGKSTFLNMLTGMEKPDSGEIVTGETIVHGYYRQSGMVLDEQKRVIEVIKDIAEVIEVADGSALSASQLLQLFMFPPKSQYAPIYTLSGGERRRLYLLTVLMRNPNFLILDEPTNDLDILTLQILEDFLASFGGCVMIVSHDRYFMDKLADHLFIFEGDGVISDFNGKYSEYRAMLDEKEQTKQSAKNAPRKEVAPKETAPVAKKRKLTYKEQQTFTLLEAEIEKLEVEKKILVDELSSGITDHVRLQAISARIEELSAQIDEKTMKWLALSELAE
jgi:ATP-binding cassette subfamily F protein uup